MTNKIQNVIIIGAGPAGMTAALYTSRANLAPLMIEGYQSGGQLMLTTEVENFPGFPEGINGPDLIENMKKQILKFGTQVLSEDVTSVDFSARPFTITVGEKKFLAKTVIVSTGANARWLGLESEKRLMGRGVTACATCDGAFFKDKDVVVIGGGDSAMEEALFLTRFCTKVTIIHRREELRASKIMQDRAKKHEKIEFVLNSTVVEVLGEEKVTGVKLKNTSTGEISTLDCQGMFLAIGHTPNTTLFKGILDLDEKGYVITKGKSTATNIEGVFACGDVQDHMYRQAITAAGTGCASALEAERFLEKEE
jgi:thioredoxin reductase (NADPH)